jgi:WD40 repeat protein
MKAEEVGVLSINSLLVCVLSLQWAQAKNQELTAPGKLPSGAIARFVIPADHDFGVFWSLSFSPEGKNLIATNVDGQSLTWDVAKRSLLDARPRKPEVEFSRHAKWLSPDGRRLIERERDAESEIYSYVARDPKTQKEVYRIDSKKSDLRAFLETLEFSPDGKTFLLHNAEGFPFFRHGRSGD